MFFVFYVFPKGRPHCAEDMGKKGIEKGGRITKKLRPFCVFTLKNIFGKTNILYSQDISRMFLSKFAPKSTNKFY